MNGSSERKAGGDTIAINCTDRPSDDLCAINCNLADEPTQRLSTTHSRFPILIHRREHQTRLRLGFSVLCRGRADYPFPAERCHGIPCREGWNFAVGTLQRQLAAISKARSATNADDPTTSAGHSGSPNSKRKRYCDASNQSLIALDVADIEFVAKGYLPASLSVRLRPDGYTPDFEVSGSICKQRLEVSDLSTLTGTNHLEDFSKVILQREVGFDLRSLV